MRGDPWHREPPLRARTVEEVDELGWAIHDCWIDVEALTPDRPEELGGRIVGFRLPLAFDDDERRRLPDSEWELVIRNPTSLRIEDEALIAINSISKVEVTRDRVTIEGDAPLTIEVGVNSLDVSVEARAGGGAQLSGTL
jgi:hypothetical protein